MRCSTEDFPLFILLREIGFPFEPENCLRFFVGLHHPGDAQHFRRACISIRYLWRRAKPIPNAQVLVDSGAFTELKLHGKYINSAHQYAARLVDLYKRRTVSIEGAVAQDFMCEPFMLQRTGLTILDHQRMTIERYDELIGFLRKEFGGSIPFSILPVLQGYDPADYVRHLWDYGERIERNMWVGVGSICKRNGDPDQIVAVLSAIKRERPDIRLHGFGVKLTSLKDQRVRNLLSTADSMAWSYSARRQGRGRDANSWQEAKRFVEKVEHHVL